MQWGQIKTLFIICFLILDLFLLKQFLEKRDQTQLDIISESTLEEQLQADEINIDNLPKEAVKKSYISARRHNFTDDDKERLKTQLNNQEYAIFNGDILLSEFKKPVPLNLKGSKEEIVKTVKDRIMFSEKYQYWGMSEELNTLLFFQKYQGQPIYFNQSGLLIVLLSEKNEMIQYAQTLLDDIKPQGEKQELIKPIQAVETLYNRNQLYSGDKVSKVEVGYHTLVPLSNGVQVFAPTWKFTVNKERKYFVNAIEGQIIKTDGKSFIKQTIQQLIEQIESENWSGES